MFHGLKEVLGGRHHRRHADDAVHQGDTEAPEAAAWVPPAGADLGPVRNHAVTIPPPREIPNVPPNPLLSVPGTSELTQVVRDAPDDAVIAKGDFIILGPAYPVALTLGAFVIPLAFDVPDGPYKKLGSHTYMFPTHDPATPYILHLPKKPPPDVLAAVDPLLAHLRRPPGAGGGNAATTATTATTQQAGNANGKPPAGESHMHTGQSQQQATDQQQQAATGVTATAAEGTTADQPQHDVSPSGPLDDKLTSPATEASGSSGDHVLFELAVTSPAEALKDGANVRLLRVVQSGDAIYITGQVVVKNIGYTKIVAARYTLDGWSSWREAIADWIDDDQGVADRFGFQIDVAVAVRRGEVASYGPVNAQQATLEMAVRYDLLKRNQTFWDNNNGQNYSFTIRLPSPMAVAADVEGAAGLADDTTQPVGSARAAAETVQFQRYDQGGMGSSQDRLMTSEGH
eukprot:jgi/Chrzof1/1899/Cz10g25130.t1